jgi:glutaredoxin/glutathione-dependent peroxiredoxin
LRIDSAALHWPPYNLNQETPMTIKVGDRLPNATFRLVSSDGPKVVTTQEFFGGRKIALFGLPGAFTSTCSKSHLPGFLANEAAIKAKGVDAIAETSVNDHHVLAAWAKEWNVEGKISFLADGNAEFAKAAGLEFDATAGGMGIRSQRYAMLVDDGVVKILNIEPAPGKVEVSSAENLLKGL